MGAMLITYDLNQPGQKYEKLYEAIKAVSTQWNHLMDSTWIITTSLTANQVYEKIKAPLDASDHVFVVSVAGADRQGWLNKDDWDWIRKYV